MRSTSSIDSRLIDIFREKRLQALYGRELLNDVALKATAGPVANGNQTIGTET